MTAKGGRGYTMNFDASCSFFSRQFSARIIIELSTRNDMHTLARLCQMKSQIAKDLACRRVIRVKIPVLLVSLFEAPEQLRAMSAAAAKLARPDAAERIVEECAELAGAGR